MGDENAMVRDVPMFEFDGHPVRVAIIDGKPWWAAADVLLALGYSASTVTRGLSSITSKVPSNWRCKTRCFTDANEREIIALCEEGIYFFLHHCKMPSAVPFQVWVAGEVLPSIRRTGSYSMAAAQPIVEPVAAPSPLDILRGYVAVMERQEARDRQLQQALTIQSQHVEVVAQQVGETAQRVEAMEARASDAFVALVGLPQPSDDPGAVKMRGNVNRVVRYYADATHTPYATVFNFLYREFRDRWGIDLVKRAHNEGCTPIEFAARHGLIEKLYAVAYDLFVQQARPEVAEHVN